jgi:hypothetical protein
MNSLNNELASWAALITAVVSLLGLIQSRTWLAGIGAVFVAISVITFTYARKENRRIKAADVSIDGRSLDSLNVANLRRRVSSSLVIQEAYQTARIEGDNLTMIWQYAGYCQAAKEAAIEFSIDSDNSVPFSELDCFAYDLRNDPGKKHRIRPILIGSDGISKKIAVPFLGPLTADEPFSILLACRVPGCMNADVDYYTSTMSLAQEHVRKCQVCLIFVAERPAWVRVYSCDSAGRTKLLRDLQPEPKEPEDTEYVDVDEKLIGQSTRIYLFQRRRA